MTQHSTAFQIERPVPAGDILPETTAKAAAPIAQPAKKLNFARCC